MRFSTYGEAMETVEFGTICNLNLATGDYFARAEDSGCEGCYVEIAKWNEAARQWQRYAFLKCFGGEVTSPPDLNAHMTSEWIANTINGMGSDYASVIHRMPNYEDVPLPV